VKSNELDRNRKSGASQVVSLAVWRRELGISATTAWRYCKSGWLHPLNIAGRPYLKLSDIAEFEARAAAGEFAKPPSGAAKKSASVQVEIGRINTGGLAG
jgi:hypothetical protein